MQLEISVCKEGKNKWLRAFATNERTNATYENFFTLSLSFFLILSPTTFSFSHSHTYCFILKDCDRLSLSLSQPIPTQYLTLYLGRQLDIFHVVGCCFPPTRPHKHTFSLSLSLSHSLKMCTTDGKKSLSDWTFNPIGSPSHILSPLVLSAREKTLICDTQNKQDICKQDFSQRFLHQMSQLTIT